MGQAHVVRALANALEQGRIHHAWLFSGTRGIGKTTIARILARCLNCERGVSARPCGECGACRAILEGNFVDLVEVDAASRTKVEETRDLLESVPYAPAAGRYKVYLIDEVHMLSNSSFNALLKTLEEPPEHTKFLFATTEPHKVPLTVRSRCLVFALHRLPAADIATALAGIVEKEGLTAEPAALVALARAAGGSVRDALSLLDQAFAFGGGALTAKEVAGLLGMADREAIYDLLEQLAAGDGAKVLGKLEEIGRGTDDPDDVMNALAEIFALIARQQLVPAAPLPADVPVERLQRLAKTFTPETVQLDYDIAVAGKRDLHNAPDPGLALEMTLLRMLTFRPEGNTKAPVARKSETSRPPSDREQSKPEPQGGTGNDDWEALLERLELDGLTRQLAQQCSLVARENNRINLRLDSKRKQMLTPRLEKSLRQALARELGDSVKLAIKVADGETPMTPAGKRSARQAERQARAEKAIAEDPHVAALRETFDAEIIPGTIRPE